METKVVNSTHNPTIGILDETDYSLAENPYAPPPPVPHKSRDAFIDEHNDDDVYSPVSTNSYIGKLSHGITILSLYMFIHVISKALIFKHYGKKGLP